MTQNVFSDGTATGAASPDWDTLSFSRSPAGASTSQSAGINPYGSNNPSYQGASSTPTYSSQSYQAPTYTPTTSQSLLDLYNRGLQASASGRGSHRSGGLATSAQAQAALQERADIENALLRQALKSAKIANRMAGLRYGPTPEAYAAANVAFQDIMSRTRTDMGRVAGKGIEQAIDDRTSALDQLTDVYGIARDDLSREIRTGRSDIELARDQAREDITRGYTEAQIPFQDFDDATGETFNYYRDLVTGDFGDQFSQFQESPAYQFALQEGLSSIERAAAAKGMLQSGQTLEDLTKYASDYASQQFQNYYNSRVGQARDLANLGFTGGQALSTLRAGQADQLAGIGMQSAEGLANLQSVLGQGLAGLGQSQAGNITDLYGSYAPVIGSFGIQEMQGVLSAGRAQAQAAQQAALGAGSTFFRPDMSNIREI